MQPSVMIIQARDSTALLITQPDHAALSGRIMTHWKHRDFGAHPRRASILLATCEHDNGWREVDATPVWDPTTGRLLDFINVPADVRRAIWPRGVERLSKDPWAAALVAQHALHVYRHYREDPEWIRFFGDLETLRDTHLRRAKPAKASTPVDLEDLLADYFFVRMGDLLSLTFCNGWSEAPDELGYAIRCSSDQLSVAPDPFGGVEISMDVPARELPNGPFPSGSDVAAAFSAARVVSHRGVVRGMPSAATL